MRHFWAGFAAGAIVVAGLVVIGWTAGLLAFAWPFGRGEAIALDGDQTLDPDDADAAIEQGGRARRRRGRRGAAPGQPADHTETRAQRSQRTPRGEATTGDEIGEPATRSIDLQARGGEQQLSDAQVNAAFDRAFPRMRRCLALAAGEDEVRGRVAFTVRITPNGRVSAVRLSGPAAVTTGEAGDCLRGAARGIAFPSFDGPEMTVRWHLTLD